MKILIVEDDRMIRHLMSRRLTIEGHDVILAEDGEDGVRRARIELPDLILMDIGLPKLNGWQATQRIRSIPMTRSIPIIALTAFAMQEDGERCIAAGCDDYETKPVNFKRLFQKVNALQERKQHEADARERGV